ncbi:VOC family protein [Algiphilus aromaticivorans]|uniref:VOC family protein n=1 Tax=Algiphilus aromaticivorans TaxID=382454 RepID=UPI0005C1F7A4|nr:VOC family protein [Algiphilus aromaticivorans]
MPCPFHLAIPVDDLAAARHFYGVLMGCREGRSAAHWIDFDFFGHQLVTHLADLGMKHGTHNAVDGDDVPVPHFGIVLDMGQWRDLAARLREADVDFLIAPRIRFAGEVGEQGTLFVRDPAGNALEFKGFVDVEGQLFRR